MIIIIMVMIMDGKGSSSSCYCYYFYLVSSNEYDNSADKGNTLKVVASCFFARSPGSSSSSRVSVSIKL